MRRVTGAQGERFASIAGAAGQFFAVWEGSNPTDVRGARISDGGNVLDSDGFAIGTIGESTNSARDVDHSVELAPRR